MNKQKNIFQKTTQALSHILHTDTSLSHDVIIFSHLRWDFVFQRPQHIITRLAKNRKILFIEEPIHFGDGDQNKARVLHPHKNITVLQPKIKPEDMLQELPLLIAKHLRALNFHDPMLWFYTAGFSEIIPFINHSLIVYDCMDELSAFKGASTQLIAQEKYLLSEADIVFTGGKSLYEEKRKWANNVFCFPSSVDQNHFAKAKKNDSTQPFDIRTISHPTVGFYGVLDERLDTALLKQVAFRLPHINFLMIGPVIKIDSNDLPHLSNVHYLGVKSYDDLPKYLKEIDIAMMPFAINKATQFISPTKTLEFMAAEKPIISTPITDVVRDYKDIISIVTTPQAFVQAINHFIYESKAEREQRAVIYKNVLKQTSWDNTVLQMTQRINEKYKARESVSQQFIPFYYPSLPQITSTK